jgi:hypothetical protein
MHCFYQFGHGKTPVLQTRGDVTVVIIAWITQGSILAYASFYNFSVPYHPLWLQVIALLSCAIVLILWMYCVFGVYCRYMAVKRLLSV